MAHLLTLTRCLVLLLTLLLHHSTGTRTGRLDLEVTSNQAPEAFDGSTLYVKDGDRLTLTCSATGTDGHQVSWFESTISLPSTHHQDSKNRHYTTLVLDPVQVADDGRILACRVNSSTQNKEVTLKVQKIRGQGLQMHISANPAEALSSEEIVTVNLGSKLELTCVLQDVDVDPHRLSWWYGKEQLTTLNQMSRHSATSSLILNPVAATDHLKTVTCRADGSTITRSVRLEVHNIREAVSQKPTSLLEGIQMDPITLQAIGLIIALSCGLILLVACVVIIKALHTYIKISKMLEQQVRKKQQAATSSSSSRRGQQTTPAMKQSLKNQILASVALLPQRNDAEAGTNNADQAEENEVVAISQDGDKDGKDNPTFVEEV